MSRNQVPPPKCGCGGDLYCLDSLWVAENSAGSLKVRRRTFACNLCEQRYQSYETLHLVPYKLTPHTQSFKRRLKGEYE